MTSIFTIRRMTACLLILFCQSSMAESPALADCPLVKSADVLAIFPASSNETSSKYRETPYPSRTFIWEAYAAQIQESPGHKIELPGKSRVSITRAAISSKDGGWQRVIASYGKQPLIEVQNIGNKAVWPEKRHQLSVMKEEHMIHVAAEDPDQPADEKENAERIAQFLLSTQ